MHIDHIYTFPPTGPSLLIITGLILLIVAKEMLRAHGGARADLWQRRLLFGIVPMGVLSALVGGLRFGRLVGVI